MKKVRNSGILRTIPLLITICSLSFPAYAQYGGGRGEPNDPYLIYTAEQMNAIGANPEDWDKHFKLMENIDLSGYVGGARRPAFNIIGRRYSPFTGTFDGNGHRISHLTIASGEYLGLFGRLESRAEVKNLDVVNVNITGSGDWVGGLVGMNQGGYVTCCYSTGTVSSTEHFVGGLVGWNYGDVTHCYSTGSVSGENNVGGLVGRNGGDVTHCYSTGAVSGTEYFVGGLVGYNGGVVAHCYSTGAIHGGEDVGGLVGGNDGYVTHCYSTGTVSGNNSVGGLVGRDRWEEEEGLGHFVIGHETACFWDIQTSGQATSAGGTGLTTAQMQDIQTYLDAGWDFVDEIQNGTSQIWKMPEGGGYPVLAFFSGYSPPQLQGLGTRENPYLISNSMELGAIVYYSPYAHYRLAASIDLAGIHWGTAVIPSFAGTFDGNGYTISNLTLEGGELGLFGRLESRAEVKNLGVVNVNITGSGDYIGGIAGWNFGTVAQCYSTGTVSGVHTVGGLVGDNRGSITMSYSTGTVSGEWFVGGLVGGNSGNLSDCYSVCRVDGDEDVGGLVGNNYGTIKTCYSTGNVTGNRSVGGLVGDNGGSVTHCLWDTESSGQKISAGGNGKTTAEMQILDTFIDWGCYCSKGVWTIDEGRDYPRLKWENMPGHVIPTGPCLMHATNPSPPDGAIHEDTWIILSWSSGDYAVSHDVYFGENFEDVNNGTEGTFQGNQISTFLVVGFGWFDGLVPGTTYYWRIDEVDCEGNITTGKVWTFFTRDLAPPPKGRGCFLADTPVWVNGMLVQISDVVSGQMAGGLHCSLATDCLEQIETVEEHEGTFECRDIVLESGNHISVVDAHCFMLDSGQWIAAQDLRSGLRLKTLSGTVGIKSVATRATPFVGKVYNLKVTGTDQYLVSEDGVIVRDY
jgi:hypothetical protein